MYGASEGGVRVNTTGLSQGENGMPTLNIDTSTSAIRCRRRRWSTLYLGALVMVSPVNSGPNRSGQSAASCFFAAAVSRSPRRPSR